MSKQEQEDRAKVLMEKETLTQEEQTELEYLIEETEEIETPKHYEAIQEIEDLRKLRRENVMQADKLNKLREERKQLEIKLNLIKEAKRLEKIKNQLDGKIFCDDCKKWVYPSHFD